ncbi:uncharacterized protein BCR38DRAFT_346293 [Pseudomassariella vexata]|uniref:Uncharacterized protein n=1 Tax=Pseudomassariella vexata TaxID=1141098 RepID=A0A1Y2DTW5_9PEZI|nr:uncharacterized protein BCR38DRAFT_346293 [Pseudomassariella vexata]ORY62075.1 hypothetical protein BCR38DRAFT_346293 [Pseudomassariella vexata]
MSINSTSSDAMSNNRTLIVTLSAVLSVVGVVVITIGVYLCSRNRRLKRLAIFNRGITPIDDDEIATWKVNRSSNENNEKDVARRKHDSSNSTYTHKAPSLIQYHNGSTRPSLDVSPRSPHSFIRKQSMDLPPSPPSAVLAKAPNSRSGLTDEAIPGDYPYLPSPRRQPSKLSKLPNLPAGTHRARGSRSSSIKSFADAWHGENLELSPRTSTDHSSTRAYSRIYSNAAAPPRPSFGDLAETNLFTGLSPPPLHRNDIGRAIG